MHTACKLEMSALLSSQRLFTTDVPQGQGASCSSKRAWLQNTPQMPQRAQAAASFLRKIGDGSCASHRIHERWTGGALHSQASTPNIWCPVAYERGGAPRAALIHP